MTLEINARRLMTRLEELSRFNRTPGEGVTRFSYSPEDGEARNYLLSLFKTAGLGVSVDGVGNIRARLEGSRPDTPAVLSGSHIDTVLHGGKYDGAVGTLGALEAVQTVAESGAPHSHPLEVIVFSEEEGSNFGSTLSGSKALVGRYGVDEIEEAEESRRKVDVRHGQGRGVRPCVHAFVPPAAGDCEGHDRAAYRTERSVGIEGNPSGHRRGRRGYQGYRNPSERNFQPCGSNPDEPPSRRRI